MTVGTGERDHASEIPRSEQSQTTHETRANDGHDSNEGRRCQHKNVRTEYRKRPSKTQPGLEGKGTGTGVADEGARELVMH